jgi:peptidoglycan hydrolase CwlO-like protein
MEQQTTTTDEKNDWLFAVGLVQVPFLTEETVGDLVAVTDKISASVMSLSAFQVEQTARNQKYDKFEEEIFILRSVHNDLQSKHDDLQSMHDDLQSKHDDLQSKFKEMKTQHEQVLERIKFLESRR